MARRWMAGDWDRIGIAQDLGWLALEWLVGTLTRCLETNLSRRRLVKTTRRTILYFVQNPFVRLYFVCCIMDFSFACKDEKSGQYVINNIAVWHRRVVE